VDSNGIPDAIQWHEGMLLGPQHLQQLSRRSESLVHYYLHSIAPFFWGVRRLEIDEGLLKTGIFRVIKLEAVMPDGLVVSYPSGCKEELQLQLDKATHPTTIYLAVPARAALATRGDLPRYASVEGEEVVDESSGDGKVAIPRLKPQLRLLSGEVPSAKFVSFPLAEYQQRDQAFVLTDFLPPTTIVPEGSVIWEMCSQTIDKIREHALFLSEQMQSPGSAGRDNLLLQARTQIQCLVTGLPHFEAVLKTRSSHPFDLYKAFCLLAGNLAGLGHGLVPPPLGPYRHDDIHATFTEIANYAFEVMKEGIPREYTLRYFQAADKQEHAFSLLFEEEWQGRPIFLAMRGQAGMSEKDVVTWGEKCCIGSQSVMESIRDKRILGPARELIQRYESLVPPRGVIMFKLTYDPRFIKLGEPLLLVNQGIEARMDPAEVILYVKTSEAKAAAATQR
jgi:type VI secretion system protein ImpJ